MDSYGDSRHTHIPSVFVSSTLSTLGTRERSSPLAPIQTVLANRPAFPPLSRLLLKSHVRGSNRLENS